MAISSLDNLKKLFGNKESAALEEDYRKQIESLKYDLMANQANAIQQGMGMYNTDPSGFQNALVQKGTPMSPEEVARQQQQRIAQMQTMMQIAAEQKFKEEAYIKGAVSSEELDSVAYSLSLEEVRTIWLAAFGSKWVAQESMEGDHRLMFQRLYTNNEFESAIVTDPATRAFKTRYRLKGT